MRRCLFVIPGDIGTPTGGYAYAREVLRHWPEGAPAIAHVPIPGSFPSPAESDLALTRDILLRAADGGGVALIDGLAYGAFPGALIRQLPMPIVALVHHPLGLEAGLSEEHKHRLLESEKAALAQARHVIVTSPATARLLVETFGVPPSRITVAEPGVEPAGRAPGSPPGQPLHILSAGAVTPRKGSDVLIGALAKVRDLPWRATIAGALDRDPDTARLVQAMVAERGLTDRIRFTGALDAEALAALYGAADIFALATRYEGYGMVFAEAMARGLPIVCSGEGAVRETVPRGAGLHVRADDADGFAGALRMMLEDVSFRKGCAEAAWRHAQTLPRWADTARAVAAAIERIAQ